MHWLFPYATRPSCDKPVGCDMVKQFLDSELQGRVGAWPNSLESVQLDLAKGETRMHLISYLKRIPSAIVSHD